jgi:hypothetical protein
LIFIKKNPFISVKTGFFFANPLNNRQFTIPLHSLQMRTLSTDPKAGSLTGTPKILSNYVTNSV